MVIVDTNVVIRYLTQDHPQHYVRAEAFFGRVLSGQTQAYLPDAVIAECIYVLRSVYGLGRQAVASGLEDFINYLGLRLDHNREVKHALRIYGSSKLDFVDALLLALSQSTGWDLFSFDKKLGG